MKIVEAMPFAAELLTPSYEECFRREGAAPGEGEIALDAGWGIVTEDEHELVAVAAEHLGNFVRTSLGGELGGEDAPRAIRLRVDPDLDASPEAHRLRIGADAIEITGAGPAGVLQGVFRLENLMRERGGPIVPLGEETRTPLFERRIHRSPLAPFYVEELTGERGDRLRRPRCACDFRVPTGRPVTCAISSWITRRFAGRAPAAGVTADDAGTSAGTPADDGPAGDSEVGAGP